SDFDYYYSCGPLPMLQAIKEKLSHKCGSISLEERMGCGVGACMAALYLRMTPKVIKRYVRMVPFFQHRRFAYDGFSGSFTRIRFEESYHASIRLFWVWS